MKTIVKPTLILTAVALVCVLALSHVQRLTDPYLRAQEKKKQEESLALVLPGYTMKPPVTVKVNGVPFVYWEGEKKADDGTTARGFAFMSGSNGYGGPVVSMIGVDEKGIILGISIVTQSETPGLGSACTEAANSETLRDVLFGRKKPARGGEAPVPWFQRQFRELDAGREIRIVKLGPWRPDMRERLIEENAISALTGATITSTAVVRSVTDGMARLRKAREIAAGRDGGPAQ